MKKHITIFIVLMFSISLQAQMASINNDHPQKLTKSQLEQKDQKMYISSQLDLPLYYKSFVAVYQLDSMVYEEFDDTDSAWYLDDVDALLYNSDKECIAEIDFDFDQGHNRDTSNIYWYMYDVDGNFIQEIGAYWDYGLWDTSWKEVYIYSPTNQYLGLIEYDYNNGQWEESWKSEYTYDSNGYLIKEERFDWENGMWEMYARETYTNHSDGRIEVILEYYDSGSGLQLNDSTYYSYNSSLQLVENTRYDWYNSTWEAYYRYSYTYYTSGDLETRTSFYFYNSSWDTSYRYHYIYNTQGLLTERIELDWNSGQWENDYKDEYTYNMNYSVPLITANPYYLDDIDDMMLTEKEFYWDYNNSVWLDYGREILYWSHTGLNLYEETVENIKIYPLPTTDYLIIEASSLNEASFMLYNLNGCLMQKNKLNNGQTVLDLTGYPKGVYVLRIEQIGGTTAKRVIVQ